MDRAGSGRKAPPSSASGAQRPPWRLDRREFLLDTLRASAVLGLGGLAAACTSDTGKQSASSNQNAKPQRGGSLRIGAGEGVPADYFIGNALGQHVFTFVQFAWPLFLQSPTQREPVNALAESYDVSSDALTHTFTIRSGLKFHDGSPLDADAVAKNFRSVLFAKDPLRDKGGYAQNLAFGIPPAVRSVDVVDERTLKMVLTQPRTDVRRILWYFYVLNPTILARKDYGTDAGALRDAGSGPFRVTRFTPSSFIEMERFDGFFTPAWLDRIRFEVIADDAAMSLSLRGGNIDVAVQPAPTDEEALSKDPAFSEHIASRPGLNLFYELTPRQEKLATDKRVREAIWYSLNQEAYVKAFFAPGTASPSTQPVVVSGARAYNTALRDRPYDPDRARQLLSDAGAQGFTLKAIGPPSVGALSNTKQLFEAMRSDMEKAGINLQINVTDPATVAAEQANHDIFLNPFDYEDDFLVMPIFFTGLGGIKPPDPRATNPEVARLLDAASKTANADQQAGYFQQLMKLNQDELLMGIPLTEVSKSAVAKKEIRDFRVAYTQDPENSTWIQRNEG
jgi:peptide/nickel transport system substrate-binding protein